MRDSIVEVMDLFRLVDKAITLKGDEISEHERLFQKAYENLLRITYELQEQAISQQYQ